MAAKVILIYHGPTPRKDRAADQLEALGYEIVQLYPYAGDVIPPLTGDVAGTVVYGGKYCISDIASMPFLQDEIRWLEACMKAGVPTLGICQGAQMIAHLLGADVGPPESGHCEFGYYPLEPTHNGFIPRGLSVPQAHFHAFDLPKGAELLARSAAFPHQAFRYGPKIYGFQFHPEVTAGIFEDWQNGDWAGGLYDMPGAQTRAEQNACEAEAQAGVDLWFRAFLTDLFGESK